MEEWSPLTINKIGCGGSEIAAAWLSKELVNLGNKVILYGTVNGVFNGVIYRKNLSIAPCDIFISSRIPDILAQPYPTRIKALWGHDVDCYDRLTPDIASQLDYIILLSHWHKDHWKRVYPWLKDCDVIDSAGWRQTYTDFMSRDIFHPQGKCSKLPKLIILPDAILPERFTGIITERYPHRFIWASSPDRGLEELLLLWPKITELWKDAELKIFYGWEYFNSTLIYKEQRELKSRLLELIKQPGVEWCGRVNQQALAQEFMHSDIWLYPPHLFRETCCITALEAMASGVLCFYRPNGALGETVGNIGIVIPMDSKPDAIIQLLSTTLTNTELCATLRREGRDWAMQQTWQHRASKLLEVFNE